jgi:hypothetical protein
MGPLDPTPPLVTAGGMPNSPIDQNAALAELLRRRSAAQKQAQMSAGNSEMWNNTIGQPRFTNTIDGGRDQPDQVVVNWGDILGKGVSNYMGAKERKTAIDKDDEVKQINNDFMQSTLANDPTATKLYGAAQAGMPGAEKALMEHMAPKKQSMAVLVQGLTSGALDPAIAEELAPQFGLDPNVVRSAAEYAAKASQRKEEMKFEQQKELQGIKQTGAMELQNNKPTKTGYTQAELNAMPIEQRIAAVQASTGRETAESKARGKMKVQAEQDFPKADYAIKNLEDVIGFADKATYYPGTGGLVDPKLVPNNPNNTMLKQAINQIVLDAAGGKLGGGVSNADVEFLKSATAMLNAGNRDTVVAQLNRILANQKMHRSQLAKQAGIEEAPIKSNSPTSKYDYRTSKAVPSFDDVWKEVGGE